MKIMCAKKNDEIIKLDETDIKILKIINDDVRISYRQISRDLGISVGTVHNRIDKMVKSGVIKKFSPVIDHEKLGFVLTTIIGVRVKGGKLKNWEEKTFYVWCDAIQRTILTGGALTISGTMKLDLNNTANMTLLSKIHSFITDGEISQFRDLVQFELLSGVSNSTMTYTKYQAPVVIKMSDLGGNAEDEAEFSYELSLQGKGTVVTSS